ncbi:MAG: DUF2798 domain-containing protein [Granulosicoccus sp.]|nr:DUF2798 domain-containing protein [Granulosicoccus sp.]
MKINTFTLINSVILTGIMTLIISGVSTFKAAGMVSGVVEIWMSAWITSWLIAIPLMYFVGPAVRSLVSRLLQE